LRRQFFGKKVCGDEGKIPVIKQKKFLNSKVSLEGSPTKKGKKKQVCKEAAFAAEAWFIGEGRKSALRKKKKYEGSRLREQGGGKEKSPRFDISDLLEQKQLLMRGYLLYAGS